jgi:branched-chain amino acid transport system permease protein
MAQVIINGLVVGTTYALVALGLAIVFGIMRLVNFAHGQIYVVGGFVVYYAMTAGGLTFPAALALAIAATAVVGVVLEVAFFAPVVARVKREEGTMLLAMGLALFMEQGCYLLFGELQRGAPPIAVGVFKVAGAFLPAGRAAVMAIAAILIIATIVFINHTRPGRALRAVAQDREAAQLQGVNLLRMNALGFGLGAALAGAAGGLLVTVVGIQAGGGTAVSVKAFIMIMLGGGGVVSGAVLGGFLLGFAESVGYMLLPGSITYIVIFAAMMLFLMARPHGLVGRPWG